MRSDSYDLQRFVDAQDGVYTAVIQELRSGTKRSHWMWFIFPQVRGLGSSSMSMRFGITSREEAVCYLQHPILGRRLRECTSLVLAIEGRSSREIFGTVDDLKFRSSMTLFARVAGSDTLFDEALRKYYGGVEDERTLGTLGLNRN